MNILTSTELAAKIALLDEIPGTFVHRKDTEANIDLIVLANGELAFTTDTYEIRMGDGSTAGGIFVSGRWVHYASVLSDTVSSNYNSVINAPIKQGRTYEYHGFVEATNMGTAVVANLVSSAGFQGFGADVLVGSNVSPLFGPATYLLKRYMNSNTGAEDTTITFHAWNLPPTVIWEPGMTANESISLGVASGNQYKTVEWSGFIRNGETPNQSLVVKVKTPGGAAPGIGVRSHFMIRRIQ